MLRGAPWGIVLVLGVPHAAPWGFVLVLPQHRAVPGVLMGRWQCVGCPLCPGGGVSLVLLSWFSVAADGCGVGNLSEPVAVSLRHPGEGTDPVAAYWNFEVLGGMGGWSAEGCQLAAREPNVTSLQCRHLSNVAVLMVGVGRAAGGEGRVVEGVRGTGHCCGV